MPVTQRPADSRRGRDPTNVILRIADKGTPAKFKQYVRVFNLPTVYTPGLQQYKNCTRIKVQHETADLETDGTTKHVGAARASSWQGRCAAGSRAQHRPTRPRLAEEVADSRGGEGWRDSRGAGRGRRGGRVGLRGGVRRRVCFRLPLLLGGPGSRVQARACVAARRAPPLMMRAPTCLYYDFNIGCFTWV